MKLRARVHQYAKVNYEMVDNLQFKTSDLAMSNAACHFNAVQAARCGRADKVWLVWAGGDEGCVHFINSLDGKFFDDTWFDTSTPREYIIIRQVHDAEFDGIYELLCDTKKCLTRINGNFIESFLTNRNPHRGM